MNKPPTELTQILLDSQSPDESIRQAAEQKLAAAEHSGEFLQLLVDELQSENRLSNVRQLAGIILKNAIFGVDPDIDCTKNNKWMEVSPEIIKYIQSAVLATLQSPCEEARSAACQVISKIGRRSLMCNKWPELLPTLLNMVTLKDNPYTHRKAAVTAAGYLCEDIKYISINLGIPVPTSDINNELITIVTHTLRDSHNEVVLAGCKAFYHAVLLASENMSKEEERNFIFQIVAMCLNNQDLHVQHAAWECVLQITSEYYMYLNAYAFGIGQLSIAAIKKAIVTGDQVDIPEDTKESIENVALAAIEFWSTILDEELIICEDSLNSESLHDFLKNAKNVLLPLLFEAMTKQPSEDNDMDDWTLAMAAGTCLGLCAQVLGNDILDLSLEFINSHFANENWKLREAAILAYGSIMNGPSSDKLEPLIVQSFTHLCNALNDKSVAVRDSTAWTIGRIASFHTNCVLNLLGTPDQPGLMNILLEKLHDVPRVSSYVCFSIHEIAKKIRENCKDSNNSLPTPLDPFFRQIATSLLQVAQQPQAAENNLRTSAFEALSEVVEAVNGPESLEIIEAILNKLMMWLEHSFTLVTPDKDQIYILQGLICGCLNNITDRLGHTRLNHQHELVDRLFKLYSAVIKVNFLGGSENISSNNSGLHSNSPGYSNNSSGLFSNESTNYQDITKVGSEEDAILALSTLIRVVGTSFERHLPALSEILKSGLQTPSEIKFCRACISIVSELVCGLNMDSTNVDGYIFELIPIFYEILQSNTTPICLKPALITTLGDIILCMGSKVEHSIQPFLLLLQHAALTKISDGPNTEEWIDYIHELRNSVLEAYSSIIHGLRDTKSFNSLDNQLNSLLVCIQSIVMDETSTPSNICKAIEVMTDLVTSHRSNLVSHLMKLPLYTDILKIGKHSPDIHIQNQTLLLEEAVSRCQKTNISKIN